VNFCNSKARLDFLGTPKLLLREPKMKKKSRKFYYWAYWIFMKNIPKYPVFFCKPLFFYKMRRAVFI